MWLQCCQRNHLANNGIVGTTNSCSTSHQEILSEDSVDISGVASKINQEYVLSSHRLLSGAKLAGSLASPIQINPTCEDDDVAGCLLLLNENSMLISGITKAVVASIVSANQDYPTGTLADEELPPSWKKWFKNFIPQLELWMKNYCIHLE